MQVVNSGESLVNITERNGPFQNSDGEKTFDLVLWMKGPSTLRCEGEREGEGGGGEVYAENAAAPTRTSALLLLVSSAVWGGLNRGEVLPQASFDPFRVDLHTRP